MTPPVRRTTKCIRAALASRLVGLGVALGMSVPAVSVGAQRVDSVPSSPTARAATDADVRFMQEMIGHHQQAVEMVALVPQRTRRRDLRLLAERIGLSQGDEIVQMRSWLAKHASGEMGTHEMSTHAMDAHGAMSMPGMLTSAQMSALRRATGARFDRLFLDGMIQHHVGALTMVKQLMSTAGAAQESRLNRFVIDVDADQRAEIARMRRLLR